VGRRIQDGKPSLTRASNNSQEAHTVVVDGHIDIIKACAVKSQDKLSSVIRTPESEAIVEALTCDGVRGHTVKVGFVERLDKCSALKRLNWQT
jgi:hypothetical protein